MKKNTNGACIAPAPANTPAGVALMVNENNGAIALMPAPVKALKPKVKTVGKVASSKMILATSGKQFMNVTFMEKNKSKAKNAPALVKRNITCKIARKDAPDAKGPKFQDLLNLGKLRVKEATGPNKGQFRMINLDTVIAGKTGGVQFKVRK